MKSLSRTYPPKWILRALEARKAASLSGCQSLGRKLLTISSALVLAGLPSFAMASPIFTKGADEDVPHLQSGPDAIVFNHSASSWDRSGSSLRGSRNLIDFGRRNGIPKIAIIDQITLDRHAWKSTEEYIAAQSSYFFEPKEIDLVVASDGGAHMVEFAGAKRIFFSGGFYRLCLCEALRDTLRWTRSYLESSGFEMIVVTDAVYDHSVEKGSSSLHDRIEMEKRKGSFSETAFVQDLSLYLTLGSCPQNSKRQRQLKLDGVVFRFFLDDRYIMSVNGGQTTPYHEARPLPREKLINVRFVHSRDLDFLPR